MKTITIEQIIAIEEAKRQEVLSTSNRGRSAYQLAQLALMHSSDGAKAAASLLLAMEFGKAFDFTCLLRFDTSNRAHADLVMQGYKAHALWPSRWMSEAGYPGIGIMDTVKDKWLRLIEESA